MQPSEYGFDWDTIDQIDPKCSPVNIAVVYECIFYVVMETAESVAACHLGIVIDLLQELLQ